MTQDTTHTTSRLRGISDISWTLSLSLTLTHGSRCSLPADSWPCSAAQSPQVTIPLPLSIHLTALPHTASKIEKKQI
eukprot:scaffold28300_cov146-Isochrysis_galbana.AAC.1